MITQTPNTENEIAEAFFQYRKGVVDTRNDMNKSYLEYLTRNIHEKRELFKYIGTISVAILGLSSFILEKSKYLPYTSISLILHAVIILMVVMYFRELLDKEGNELQTQQDRYNGLSDKALDTVDSYINVQQFTIEKYKEFWKEIQSSPEAKDIHQENENLKNDRQNRDKNLDYTGEFVVSLLMAATLLMVLGSIGKVLSVTNLSLSIILILILSFMNIALNISKLVSKIANFLKIRLFSRFRKIPK